MIRTTLRGSLSLRAKSSTRKNPFLTVTVRNGLIHTLYHTTLPFLTKHTDNMHVTYSVTNLPHCGDHKNLIPVKIVILSSFLV